MTLSADVRFVSPMTSVPEDAIRETWKHAHATVYQAQQGQNP